MRHSRKKNLSSLPLIQATKGFLQLLQTECQYFTTPYAHGLQPYKSYPLSSSKGVWREVLNMKGKNPTQNQRKAVQAPYCCYTHRPPPKQTTANTSTAGCPGSSGARFGQGTSREHLPISLQSHSALGQ